LILSLKYFYKKNSVEEEKAEKMFLLYLAAANSMKLIIQKRVIKSGSIETFC
jgi:hypothetical protein